MTDRLACRVFGDPRPQGSKRAFATKTGRVAVVESGGANLKTWRNRLAAAVAQTRPGGGPLEDPVSLSVTFFLARPKKPKHREAPASRPDLDKLLRALLDELTGVWVRDDALVVSITARKVWEYEGQAPGALIAVSPIGAM